MEITEIDKLVLQLNAGFEALQDEYQVLHGQHQVLERKLATAREQYNELAKLCGSVQTATPPLSLSSIPGVLKGDLSSSAQVLDILEQSKENSSREAASKIRLATAAAKTLQSRLSSAHSTTSHGVRIWAGPSADNLEPAVSSMMPSISESPLEQDFTVEGKPSKLGCPFASMANKKLSSHAASVLSRYNQSGSICAASTQASSISRINGMESMARRFSHRRESFLDPIKADICGMTDHKDETSQDRPMLKRQLSESQDNAEAGVCPIRFLDQHSPEEVATYFENHKHELPRSHEICVKRYQSNEQQIRELDAKYGNLVSMIQGLGAKHKDMLPEEPADDEGEEDHADIDETVSNEKVRKWASSVSAQAAHENDDDDNDGDQRQTSDGDRQSHFDRPLRDIRVGESPSRPWGIQVPAKYLEKAESVTSSKPVKVTSSKQPMFDEQTPHNFPPETVKRSAGKCPFGHGAAQGNTVEMKKPLARSTTQQTAHNHKPSSTAGKDTVKSPRKNDSQVIITGPVFIGYSADDAIRILRETGLQIGQERAS